MPSRTVENSRRTCVLLLVVALHLALLWVLITSSGHDVTARNFATLVRLIEPEKIPPKMGAQLKAPVVHPSPIDLPKLLPPKIVVQIINPTPNARPTPAQSATASGASAPSVGDRTPPPALPPDDFSAYTKLIHNRMQAALDDIASRRVSQRDGTAVIAMEVDRSGHVLVWEIMGPAPARWMQYEINQLMAASDPLPPFPGSIRAKKSAFMIPVHFTESGTAGFGPGF